MKHIKTNILQLLLSHLTLSTAFLGLHLPFSSSKNDDNPFEQWELTNLLNPHTSDFDLTIDTISHNLIFSNMAILDEDEHALCVKHAIEPIYSTCMSTDPTKSNTLKTMDKSRISIDLLICELKGMYTTPNPNNSTLTNYEEGGGMNSLIYEILTLHRTTKVRDVKFYKEVLEIVKKNGNLWTTYTLKNDRLDKLCSEFGQPLQKYHLENVVKRYTEMLKEEIQKNNERGIEAIMGLQKYLQEKMEELSKEVKEEVKEEVKVNVAQVKERIDVLSSRQKELIGNFTIQFKNFSLSNKQALRNVTSIIRTSLKKQKDEIDTFVNESFILKKKYFYFSKIFSNSYKLCLFMFRYKFIIAVVAVIYWRYKTIISLAILIALAVYLIAIDLINYMNLQNVSQQIFNEILPQLLTKTPKVILVIIVLKKIPQFWVFRKSFSILFLYLTDIFMVCLSIYDQKKATKSLFNNIETNGEFLILAIIALNLYFKSWTSIRIKLLISSVILSFVLTTMLITEYKFI